jgi:hypothetical protein
VTGGQFGRRYFQVRIGRIAVLPDILDLERIADDAGSDLVPEKPFKQVLVDRERTLREHRIPEFLELLEDFVIEAGVVVIGPGEDDDADAILPLELIEHLACAPLNVGFVRQERRECRIHRASILLWRQPQNRCPRLEHLVTEQLLVSEVHERAQILDPQFLEDVALFCEGRLGRSRRHGHGGARVRSLEMRERRVQHVDHREEDAVELLLGMLGEQQLFTDSSAQLATATDPLCIPDT